MISRYYIFRNPHGWFMGGWVFPIVLFPSLTICGWQCNNYLVIEYDL